MFINLSFNHYSNMCISLNEIRLMNCVIHIYVLGNLCSQTYPSAYSTEDLNGIWTEHTTLQSTPYITVFNVSEVNHTWDRASDNCVDGWTLSGKDIFNSCRSETCQTINANTMLPNVKEKPPFLWVDGYAVRSPVMEYYECLNFMNVNSTANVLTHRKKMMHNGVEKCSLFCQQDGNLENKDFILLQNETCYCLPKETEKSWSSKLDVLQKISTKDCDIRCDDDKFDRCGGKTYLFSAYKLIGMQMSTEIGRNCFSTSGRNTQVKPTNCKEALKFKCEEVKKTDGNRNIKVKCYENMLNWYDARRTCNQSGRYIKLLNNNCDTNNDFKADKLWHNTFIKERIIWNTSFVNEMERNQGFSCLAMKLAKNSEYILTAQSCNNKYYSLCQKDVSDSIQQNKEPETEDTQTAEVSMYVGIAVTLTILLILAIVLAVYIRRRKRYKHKDLSAAPDVYYSTVTGDQIHENQSHTLDGANADTSDANIMLSENKINRYTGNDQQEINQQGAMYEQAVVTDSNEYDVSSTSRKYSPKAEEDVGYYDHNRDADTMYDATDTKGLIQRNEMSQIYDHTRKINDDYDVSHAYRQQDKTINESVYSQSDF
ncbi:uncharacterized protein LOC143044545 isoform X1 [Mytilus galloprovincialis]|uniref:uncharacterized protein LOC143044545 isoform X1 n=1 Tax=Mytilus galloprovincialis TaxID=29158 RepID=UPI003F7CB487